jgi:protein phosphatase
VDDFTAPLPPAAAHAPERVSRGGSSAAGAVRPDNQDAFALAPRGAGEARLGTLAALADGVGGRPGGAGASREAVRYLQALYYAGVGARQPGERLRAAVEAVNVLNRLSARRLVPPAANRPSPLAADEAPLTTLVAAVVHNDRVWVANVGDSRAYLIHAGAGQIQRLTEDHRLAPGQAELATGPLDAGGGVQLNAASRIAQRGGAHVADNIISRAIGLDDTCQVDLYTYTWQTGDRLVLCSDGLSRLPLDVMAQVVLGAPPAQAAELLVAQAVRRDGSDNCTAVVLAWEAQPLRRAASARPGQRGLRAEFTTLAAALLGLVLGWLSAALVAGLYLAARASGLLGP